MILVIFSKPLKKPLVFDTKKNRKTNSKCEVVVDDDDDDDDFDDDEDNDNDVVHLATVISNKGKAREAVY